MKQGLAICLLAIMPSLGVASDRGNFSLEVSLVPGSRTGLYICEAQVKDLDSGEVIAAPRIVGKAGAPATASTRSGDLLTVLKVSVDSATSMGTAELTVSRGGKVVASQKSHLRLK